MAFTSRRGRPKSAPIETDYGTQQLRQKRKAHMTTEPLDWLLAQEVITEKQHWCGVHFRWLYTLRYGSYTPQSLDLAQQYGFISSIEDENWQRKKEEEWHIAMSLLRNYNLQQVTLKHCVFLSTLPSAWTSAPLHCNNIQMLIVALSELEKLWCKNTHK